MAEALAEENVDVGEVTLSGGEGGHMEVSVFLTWQGEELEASVTI